MIDLTVTLSAGSFEKCLLQHINFQWYCTIYFRKTTCANHITDWFDFRSCFGFCENNWSAVKKSTSHS